MRLCVMRFTALRGSEGDPLLGFAASIRALESMVSRLVRHVFTTQLVKYANLFENNDPTSPYELLLSETYGPRVAVMLAHSYRYYGQRYVQTAQAEQKFASAVYAIARKRHKTPLVISNRAKRMAATICLASAAVRDGCEKVGISEEAFRELVTRAVLRDPSVCLNLYLTCLKLKPEPSSSHCSALCLR